MADRAQGSADRRNDRRHGPTRRDVPRDDRDRTATPEELDDYKRFVLNVADKVANAHREGEESVSADERAAIEAIAANLGTAAP